MKFAAVIIASASDVQDGTLQHVVAEVSQREHLRTTAVRVVDDHVWILLTIRPCMN